MGFGLRFGVGANDVENFALAVVGNQIRKKAFDRSAFSLKHRPDLDEQPVLVTTLVGVRRTMRLRRSLVKTAMMISPYQCKASSSRK